MVVKDYSKRKIADGNFRRDFFHQTQWAGFLLGERPKSSIQHLRSSNPAFRAYSDEELERLLEDGARETVKTDGMNDDTYENIKKEREEKLKLVDSFMN